MYAAALWEAGSAELGGTPLEATTAAMATTDITAKIARDRRLLLVVRTIGA